MSFHGTHAGVSFQWFGKEHGARTTQLPALPLRVSKCCANKLVPLDRSPADTRSLAHSVQAGNISDSNGQYFKGGYERRG